MAKEGKLGWGGGLNRRPSFKGRVVVSSWKGRPRISIQPIREKKKLSDKQKEAMAKFSEAAELAKVCAPSQQLVAYELTNGTQYFPRDILYMAFYGRIATLILDGSTKVYSVAVKNDVSEVLDAIGQTPGDILYRAETGWQALPAGDNDTVLSMVDGKPSWQAGGGGGGGGGFRGASVVAPGLGWSTNIYATNCQPFIPTEAFNVASISGNIRSNLSVNSCRLTLVRLQGDGSSGVIDEILFMSDPIALDPNLAHQPRVYLPEPIPVSPDFVYGVCMSRANGNNGDDMSTATVSALNGSLLPNAPVVCPSRKFEWHLLIPLEGLAPDRSNDGHFLNWPEG